MQRRLRQSLDAGGEPPGRSPEPVDGPLRISVNTSLVAVGYLGSGERRRPTIVGEATTVAGALQPHVPPGTILITDATARQVTGYVRLDPLAPVRLRCDRPLLRDGHAQGRTAGLAGCLARSADRYPTEGRRPGGRGRDRAQRLHGEQSATPT
jgi:hypothetical protein